EASWTIYLTAALLNMASVTGVLLVARSARNRVLYLSTAVFMALMLAFLGLQWLSDPWNPNVTVLPFTLFLFVGGAVAAGRHRLVPLLVAVASFVVQTHIEYAATTAVVGMVALGLMLSPVPRHGRAEHPARQALPWLAVGLLVVVVLWAPPLIEQIRS